MAVACGVPAPQQASRLPAPIEQAGAPLHRTDSPVARARPTTTPNRDEPDRNQGRTRAVPETEQAEPDRSEPNRPEPGPRDGPARATRRRVAALPPRRPPPRLTLPASRYARETWTQRKRHFRALGRLPSVEEEKAPDADATEGPTP
ncbi:hypothetical protein SCA03_20370 [Streptomyces cacaoi]|uniref:Uncharacterized protein n=1 Tax=Streptomyces cacaoi TaxID=1898 RepID=A0A4Y3QVP8_STRCI|nr:hypothetical protein SCA03_20370 [Streptomyces cacaoi]